jgi:8-oxo-dGTP pyrophosphatase MutT (NUDIX family)
MVNTITKEDFLEWVQLLEKKLALQLPGQEAHKIMAAKSSLNFSTTANELTKKSAVLILFYPFENKIYVPLILRPPYDGMHGGQMAFPGGRSEKSDENLIRTALREAQEEIGILPRDVHIIGQLTELYIPVSNFMVQPVIGFSLTKPTFYPDPREVEKIIEINFDEMADPKTISIEALNIKGVEVNAKLYNLQNHKIWGATAMMIAELLMIVNSNEI